jgi:hypothetical protein
VGVHGSYAAALAVAWGPASDAIQTTESALLAHRETMVGPSVIEVIRGYRAGAYLPANLAPQGEQVLDQIRQRQAGILAAEIGWFEARTWLRPAVGGGLWLAMVIGGPASMVEVGANVVAWTTALATLGGLVVSCARILEIKAPTQVPAAIATRIPTIIPLATLFGAVLLSRGVGPPGEQLAHALWWAISTLAGGSNEPLSIGMTSALAAAGRALTQSFAAGLLALIPLPFQGSAGGIVVTLFLLAAYKLRPSWNPSSVFSHGAKQALWLMGFIPPTLQAAVGGLAAIWLTPLLFGAQASVTSQTAVFVHTLPALLHGLRLAYWHVRGSSARPPPAGIYLAVLAGAAHTVFMNARGTHAIAHRPKRRTEAPRGRMLLMAPGGGLYTVGR